MNNINPLEKNEITNLLKENKGSALLMKLFNMMNQGIEITKDQEKEIIWRANKEIKNIYKFLEDALNVNTIIPDFFFISIIFKNITKFERIINNSVELEYSNNPIINLLNNKKITSTNVVIKNLYENKLKSPFFKRQLFLFWENNLKDGTVRYLNNQDYLNKIENPVQILKNNLFEQATPNEYIESLRMISKLRFHIERGDTDEWFKNSQRNLLNLIDNSNYYDLIKNLEENHQKIKKNNIAIEEEELKINKIADQIQNNIEPLKYNELPLDCKLKIEEIKTLYKEFIQEYNLLNEEEKFIVTNIYQKRLPEVIMNFINIKKEYRETLENINNQNANELLLKSLTNILLTFEKIELELTEKKIQQLNTDNKYLKEIKQRI